MLDEALQQAIAVIRRSGESLAVATELVEALDYQEKVKLRGLLPAFEPSAQREPPELLPRGYTQLPSRELLEQAPWRLTPHEEMRGIRCQLSFYWGHQLRGFSHVVQDRMRIGGPSPIAEAAHILHSELRRLQEEERPTPLEGYQPGMNYLERSRASQARAEARFQDYAATIPGWPND